MGILVRREIKNMKLSSLLFAATSALVCNENVLVEETVITERKQLATGVKFKSQFSIDFDLNLDGELTPGGSDIWHTDNKEGWTSVIEVGNPNKMDGPSQLCGRNVANVWIAPGSYAKLVVLMCQNHSKYGMFETIDLKPFFNQKWGTISIDQVVNAQVEFEISLKVNGQNQSLKYTGYLGWSSWVQEFVNESPVGFSGLDFSIGNSFPYLPIVYYGHYKQVGHLAPLAKGKIRNFKYSTGDEHDALAECDLPDGCVVNPSKCISEWQNRGSSVKGKAGKKASSLYWKCAKKQRNRVLGKKPKVSRRSVGGVDKMKTRKCTWTDCEQSFLDGKTWADFNAKKWKSCARKNMKY